MSSHAIPLSEVAFIIIYFLFKRIHSGGPCNAFILINYSFIFILMVDDENENALQGWARLRKEWNPTISFLFLFVFSLTWWSGFIFVWVYGPVSLTIYSFIAAEPHTLIRLWHLVCGSSLWKEWQSVTCCQPDDWRVHFVWTLCVGLSIICLLAAISLTWRKFTHFVPSYLERSSSC